ncbi:MAG: hypothetical protein P8J20_19510 [Novosphingobium sp.]|nr:hypothetical protein [Novosphingobium sp.]
MKQYVYGILIASAALLSGTAHADHHAEAKAETPAAKYSTASTDIGTLLDNDATKAVLDKHVPDFAANPQIGMARAMTLRQIQSFASDMLTDEVLNKIDADLAGIK